ncbi:MAG: hypothetical protein UR26_C0001G0099 [candidate division TM6 bacterium GW2011_GWF2_32_72]|nr:MAG: hypothetical protein UR26_C0001G0099 [candidate division TM6 bacterium GW2011_GWF2_32_72]
MSSKFCLHLFLSLNPLSLFFFQQASSNGLLRKSDQLSKSRDDLSFLYLNNQDFQEVFLKKVDDFIESKDYDKLIKCLNENLSFVSSENFEEESNFRSLKLAVKKKDVTVINILLKHFNNVSKKVKQREQWCEVSCDEDNLKESKFDDDIWRLTCAVRAHDYVQMERILSYHTLDFNKVDLNGYSALAVTLALRDATAVIILLSYGHPCAVPVNVLAQYMNKYCCWKFLENYVDFLNKLMDDFDRLNESLEKKRDLEQINSCISKIRKKDFQIMNLIKMDFDLNIRDKQGMTTLEKAICSVNIGALFFLILKNDVDSNVSKIRLKELLINMDQKKLNDFFWILQKNKMRRPLWEKRGPKKIDLICDPTDNNDICQDILEEFDAIKFDLLCDAVEKDDIEKLTFLLKIGDFSKMDISTICLNNCSDPVKSCFKSYENKAIGFDLDEEDWRSKISAQGASLSVDGRSWLKIDEFDPFK